MESQGEKHRFSIQIHAENTKYDALCSLWISYFTMPIEDCPKCRSFSPELEMLVPLFDQKTITPEQLKKLSKKSFSDRPKFLAEAFNFHSLRSPAYFQICLALKQMHRQAHDLIPIIEELMPHLIRSFILLSYNFPPLVTRLIDSKDPLYQQYIIPLPSLLYVFSLAPEKYYSDVLLSLSGFFSAIIPLLPIILSDRSNQNFCSILCEVCSELVILTQTSVSNFQSCAFIVSFIANFYQNLARAGFTDHQFITAYCGFFSIFINVPQIDKNLSQSDIGFILDLLHQNIIKGIQDVFQICIDTLFAILPLNSDPGLLQQYEEIISSIISNAFQPCFQNQTPSAIWEGKFTTYPPQDFVKGGWISTSFPKTDDKEPITRDEGIQSCLVRLAQKEPSSYEIFSKVCANLLETSFSLPLLDFSAQLLFRVGNISSISKNWFFFLPSDLFLFATSGVEEADLALTSIFRLAKKAILEGQAAQVISQLENVLNPIHPGIISLVFQFMMRFNPKETPIRASLFDKAIEIDQLLRGYLIMHSESKEVAEAHSSIVIFIDCMILNIQNNAIIFCNQPRLKYIFSLIFEPLADEYSYKWLSLGLKTSQPVSPLITAMTTFMFSLPNVSEPKKGIETSIKLIRLLVELLSTNSAEISGAVALSHLSKLPYSFLQKCESEKNSILQLLLLIIKLFKESSDFSESFAASVNSKELNLFTQLKEVACSLPFTKEAMNLLFSFVLGKSESEDIVNSEPLALLHDWAIGSPYSHEYLEVLQKLTSQSVANRYQCYKAQITDKLLSFLSKPDGSENQIASQILASVATSFFSKKDLSAFLHLIDSGTPKFSLFVLAILIGIVGTQNPISFLHLSGLFRFDGFQIEPQFKLSLLLRIIKIVDNQTLFEVSDEKGVSLKLSLDGPFLSFEFRSDSEYSKIKSEQKVTLNQWNRLTININKSEIMVSYWDAKLSSPTIKFDSSKFSLLIPANGCDIEDVDIQNSNHRIARFGAKFVRGGVCVDSDNSKNSAEFRGVLVPHTPTCAEIFMFCGGPKVLLPIFLSVPKGEIGVQYLAHLSNLLYQLFKLKEAAFVGQNIFRSLNFLLKSLPDNLFSDSLSEFLVLIYDGLTKESLIDEMANLIFLDLSLASKLTGIIPSFYVERPDVIKKLHKLSKFISQLSLTIPQPITINQKDLSTLVLSFASTLFDPNDVNLIFATAFDPRNEKVQIAFLSYILWELDEGKKEIWDKMAEFGLCIPPLYFAASKNLEIQKLAFQIIGSIRRKEVDIAFIYSLNPSKFPTDSLISLMPSIINSSFQLNVADFDWNSCYQLTTPQLLPLLVDSIKYEPRLNTFLLNCLKDLSPACISSSRIWPIFFLYLLTIDGESWIDRLASVVTLHKSTVSFVAAVIYCFCKSAGYNYSNIMTQFFTQILPSLPISDKESSFVLVEAMKVSTFTISCPPSAQKISYPNFSDFLHAVISFKLEPLACKLSSTTLPFHATLIQMSPAFNIQDSEELFANPSPSPETLCSKRLQEFSNTLALVKSDLSSLLTFVTSEPSFDEILHFQLNTFPCLEAPAASFQRQERMNSHSWNRVYEELKGEYSGIWSQSNSENHRKLDSRLDSCGRHLRTKRNRHFDQHKTSGQSRGQLLYKVLNYAKLPIAPSDTLLDFDCRLLTISTVYIGKVFLSPTSILFESKQSFDPISEVSTSSNSFDEVELQTIKSVLLRRYQLIDRAIELFLTSKKSYFFIFDSDKSRNTFVKQLERLSSFTLLTRKSSEFASLTKLWQKRRVSNYEYLFWLNMFAGRSFNDLSQYPVFPWIIKDYVSESLDLSSESTFRDLSKPIGAINEERLRELISLKKELSNGSGLYRMHYMTPAYVLHYLVRTEPFTTLHFALQKGCFDVPDRLFYSVKESWDSVTSRQPDFRELIPEFFSFPDFLLNPDKFDLGILRDGNTRVDSVFLPKWAHNATEFIIMHRIALESDFVSAHLNEWIDLIFGFKQRGKASEDNFNDFERYSYFEALDDAGADAAAIQMSASNFGTTPDQLFKEPHVIREASKMKPGSSLSCSFRFTLDLFPLNCGDVICAAVDHSTLFLVDLSGLISIYKFSSKELTFVSSSRYNGEIPKSVSMRKFCFVSPSDSCIVFSSPYLDSYEVFSLEKKTVTERSEAQSSLLTCISGDCGLLIATGTNDGAVTFRNGAGEDKFISGHDDTIVDVAVSRAMDIVVSCDVSRTLLMSSSISGKVINSFKLRATPHRMILSEQGLILVLYSNNEATTIDVIDLGGRVVAQKDCKYCVTSECLCSMPDGCDFLFVAMKSRDALLYRVYDLAPVAHVKLPAAAVCCAFSDENLCIFITLQNGESVCVSILAE